MSSTDRFTLSAPPVSLLHYPDAGVMSSLNTILEPVNRIHNSSSLFPAESILGSRGSGSGEEVDSGESSSTRRIAEVQAGMAER